MRMLIFYAQVRQARQIICQGQQGCFNGVISVCYITQFSIVFVNYWLIWKALTADGMLLLVKALLLGLRILRIWRKF